MFYSIYSMDLKTALLLAFTVLAFWFALVILTGERHPKGWRRFHAAAFFVWLVLLVSATLVFRKAAPRENVFEPFRVLRQYFATGQEYLLRSFVMNVLLFVPGGLALSNALPDRKGVSRIRGSLERTLVTTGAGLALSLVVEGLQLALSLGQFEIDDLLANTIGAFLGCSSAFLASVLLTWLENPPSRGLLGKLWTKGIEKREIFTYLYWGGMTTVINWDTFFLLEPLVNHFIANAAAWVVSVSFAFVTERVYVFGSESKGTDTFKEVLLFAPSRVISFGVEQAIIWLGLDLLGLPSFPVVFVKSIVTAVLNFIFGKFIFRKKHGEKASASEENL